MRVSIAFVFFGAMLAIVLAAGMIPSQPPAGKAEEPINNIPLESCYATAGVSGCRIIRDGGENPYSLDLGELFRGNKAGASNVALVRGKDVADAVKATRWTLTAGLRADAPIPPNPSDIKAAAGLPIWLVAYLGAGSSNPGFGRVHAAEVRGRTVRVTYSRARSNTKTDDVVQYYLWMPLGRAEAGNIGWVE
jgi:hypothetical protein